MAEDALESLTALGIVEAVAALEEGGRPAAYGGERRPHLMGDRGDQVLAQSLPGVGLALPPVVSPRQDGVVDPGYDRQEHTQQQGSPDKGEATEENAHSARCDADGKGRPERPAPEQFRQTRT